jgi:hypothetical protein
MDNPASRNEQGRFLTGNNGGPGRPRGSRNKLGEEFCLAIYEDWREHGPAVIEAVRIERPWDYLKVVAALVPRQIDLQSSDEFTSMNKEAAVAALDALIEEAIRSTPVRPSERA